MRLLSGLVLAFALLLGAAAPASAHRYCPNPRNIAVFYLRTDPLALRLADLNHDGIVDIFDIAIAGAGCR